MLKNIVPLFLLVLVIGIKSTFASDYTLVSSSIQSGSNNVQIDTKIKFTFDQPLHVFYDLELVMEGMFPMPADKIEITGFRYADANKSIEFDVTHENNSDYYWMIHDVIFEDGASLSSNHVIWYTTSHSISDYTIYGQVDIINLQFKNAPTIPKSPFQRTGFQPRSGFEIAQQSMFNLEKTMILVSNTMIEDIEEVGPEVFVAAAHSDIDGNFTIPNLRVGTYYVYGLLIDEVSFAAGAYDEDGDMEADPIVIQSGFSSFDASFSMVGFSGYQPGKFDADEYFTDVLDDITDMFPDAKLMQVRSSEIAEERNGSGKLYNTGETYLWMYTFYSPSADTAVLVINSPFYSLTIPTEKELHGKPMSELNPVGLQTLNSKNAAHYAYAYQGSNFIDGLPDDANITIHYELSRATNKYPNVFASSNTPYWEVYYQATYMNQYGEGYYKEFTLLIHAESGVLLYSSTNTSIGDHNDQLPTQVQLSQNYPNPFNPTTSISFSIPESGVVKLSVFDLLGRQVAVLADGNFPAGAHQVSWNATQMASGMYMYRLEMGTQIQVRKMTLAK